MRNGERHPNQQDLKDWSEALKTARTEQELSQRELGEMIGKGNDSIWNMEKMKRLPSLEEFDTFCDLLNMNRDKVFSQGMPMLNHERNPKFSSPKGNGNKPRNEVAVTSFEVPKEKIIAPDTGLIANTNTKREEVKVEDNLNKVDEKVTEVEVKKDFNEIKLETTKAPEINQRPDNRNWRDNNWRDNRNWRDKEQVTKRKITIQIPLNMSISNITNNGNFITVTVEEEVQGGR